MYRTRSTVLYRTLLLLCTPLWVILVSLLACNNFRPFNLGGHPPLKFREGPQEEARRGRKKFGKRRKSRIFYSSSGTQEIEDSLVNNSSVKYVYIIKIH